MKRHNTFLALLLVLDALAACGSPSAPPPPSPKATAPAGKPTNAVAATGPAPTYKFPANLCDVINFDPFIEIQRGTPKAQERRRTATTRSAASTCVATLGALPSGLIIMTSIELFTDARTGQAQFEGFKGISLRDNLDARNVDGIGDDAYFYTDARLGPTLVARHGTALIDVSVTKLGPSATIPTDVQQRLNRLVNQVLTSLPRS